MSSKSLVSRMCAALFIIAYAVAGPIRSNDVPADRAVFPVPDHDIDLYDITNLVPSDRIKLKYAERFPGTTAVNLDLNMTHPTIVVENSGFLKSVSCSSKRDILEFTTRDQSALFAIASWPETGFVIVTTNSQGCAANGERGVFLVEASRRESMIDGGWKHIYQVKVQDWKEAAPIMHIKYDSHALDPSTNMRNQRRSMDTRSPKCTPEAAGAHYCNIRGTLSRPAHKSVQSTLGSFHDCQEACTASTTCLSFGWDSKSKTCSTSAHTLKEQEITKDTSSPYVYYAKACFPCTPVASSTTDGVATTINGQWMITSVPSSSPELVAAYDSITSQLTYNSGGTLLATLQSSAGIALPTISLDASNSALQSSLSQVLLDDGLAQPTDVFSSAFDALSSYFATATAATQDLVDASAKLQPSSSSTISPDSSRRALGTSSIGKRGLLDDFQEAACNDFTEALSEDLEDACELLEAGEAIYCLASGACFDLTSPPVDWSFDYAWTETWSYQNQRIYADGVSTLSCVNCALSVSNIEFKGDIIINNANKQVLGGTVTVSESSVKTAIFGLTTTRGSAGNIVLNVNSAPLGSITGGGVFSISPTIVYGFGAQWSVDSAVNNIQAGATMTTSNAATSLDLLQKTASNAVNWQPSVSITYPSIDPASQIAPYIQSSIQMAVQIFGNTFSEVAAMTTQSIIAFGSQWDAQCSGSNNVLVTGLLSTTNAVNFGSTKYNLYNKVNSPQSQCESVYVAPPTASQISALGSVGAAFCTSYISYTPKQVTSYTEAYVSTFTVTTSLTGTTSVTPPTSTVTDTVTAQSGGPERREVAATPLARRGVPTPSIVNGWSPQEISSACSQIATGSTTVIHTSATSTIFTSTSVVGAQTTIVASTPLATVTTTVSAASSAAPTDCGVDGLQWAFFLTPSYGPSNPDDPYDSTTLGDDEVVYTGITDVVGPFSFNYGYDVNNFYGQFVGRTSHIILDHQGYLYPTQTGDYTFSFTNIDNIGMLWLGEAAYSGSDNANAAIFAYVVGATQSYTESLNAGTYYPIRVRWGNGGNPGIFDFTIIAPDGTTITQASTNGYYVQQSCDGTSAPAFSPYPTADQNGCGGSSSRSSSYSCGFSYY